MAVFKPFSVGKTLTHMHIPKSAGTSIHFGVIQTARPERLAGGLGTYLFGRFNAFDTMSPEGRASVILPQNMPSDVDYAFGHIAFPVLRDRYPDALHMTFLREPICRVISNWLFWRAWPWPGDNFWGDWGDTIRRSRHPLQEFLQDSEVATSTDNTCVRMLLGDELPFACDEFINPAADGAIFERALKNLDQFAYVDFVENPNFSADLSNWFGSPWPNIRENVTRNLSGEIRTNLAAELNPATIDLLDRRTRLDLALWKHIVLLGGLNPEALRASVLIRSLARFSTIAAGISDLRLSRIAA